MRANGSEPNKKKSPKNTGTYLFRNGLIHCVLLCLAVLVLPGRTLAQSGNYLIQTGDILSVEVLEDASLNRELLVLPDGKVTMPLAGSVIAAGRTVAQVKAALTSRLTANFSLDPNVYVSVRKLAARTPRAPEEPLRHTVYVLGEVKKPGRMQVEPGTTVLQFFAQMGGFTNFAALRRIQLRRTTAQGREHLYTLNYKAIESGQSPNGLTEIRDGDVFVVPQRKLFE